MPTSASDQTACLICAKASAPWMSVPGDWRRPECQDSYALRWCAACCFGQLVPRPDRSEIPSFYDVASYYTHEDTAANGSAAQLGILDRLRIKLAWKCDQGVDLDDPWWQRRFHDTVSVCDLGCGNGALLTRVTRLGHSGTGVEPDPEARKVAQRAGLNVLAGTAEELPDAVRASRFDCVVMTHVLEHTLDPRLAVLNAISLLNDQGVLVIETPNNDAAGLKRSGLVWPWLDVPRHLNFFTSTSLRALCAAEGLHVHGLEYRGYTRQFDANWIGMEGTIRGLFAARPGVAEKLPGANRVASAWRLLFSTARAASPRKYDSVRVIAGRTPLAAAGT